MGGRLGHSQQVTQHEPLTNTAWLALRIHELRPARIKVLDLETEAYDEALERMIRLSRTPTPNNGGADLQPLQRERE